MNAKLKVSLVLALCLAFLPSVAAARITERAEILDGQVTVTRANTLDVIVTIHHSLLDGKGSADEAFLYRSNAALPAELRDLSGQGTVVVRPDSILVAMEKGQTLSLSVRAEGDKEPSGPGFTVKSANVTLVDSGFQLTRLYARKGVNVLDVAYSQIQARQAKAEEDPSAGCISGGPGATSCSVQGSIAGGGAGCRVSCGGGTYACCNLSGCHCIGGSGGGEEI
jgi:hypothetical protein